MSFFQIIILVYFIILVFLYFYQRNLLYHPNENNYSSDQISVPIEKVKVNTELYRLNVFSRLDEIPKGLLV